MPLKSFSPWCAFTNLSLFWTRKEPGFTWISLRCSTWAHKPRFLFWTCFLDRFRRWLVQRWIWVGRRHLGEFDDKFLESLKVEFKMSSTTFYVVLWVYMSTVPAPIDIPKKMVLLIPWVLLKSLNTELRVLAYCGSRIIKSPVLNRSLGCRRNRHWVVF